MTGESAPRTDGGARRERAAAVLERRYRRLLAWYPADYRAANADDMLGVALARSVPGQRRPGLGETANLIGSGIRMRLAAIWRQPAWRGAAAVLAVVGPVLLAAAGFARLVTPDWLLLIRGPGLYFPGDWPAVSGLVCGMWWALVAWAWMLRRPRLAAAGACAGAVGQVVLLVHDSAEEPGSLTLSYWTAIAALVVAVAALTAVRRTDRPLSWPSFAAIAAGATALAGWPAIEALITYPAAPGENGFMPVRLIPAYGWAGYGVLAFIAVTMLVAVWRLDAAVRRRVLVLFLPALAATALASWGFTGPQPGFVPLQAPVLWPSQWPALAGVPAAGLVVGLVWLRLRERALRRRATADGCADG